MKRKIVYISGTRADYGLMQSTLMEMGRRDDLELEIIATGMHLMDEFGHTVDQIERDGFIVHKVNEIHQADRKGSMAWFVGGFIQSLTEIIEQISPDIILLLGDRGEMLAGAVVGAYLSISVAHLHGGETSSTVDDLVRNAITKLAQIHLPATAKSAERLMSIGEDPSRIYVVGAPGLDAILNDIPADPEYLAKKYGLDLFAPLLLVIQHPVTLEAEFAAEQMMETMQAILDLKYQTIIIYPNADAGGRKMIEVIQKCSHQPYIKTFKSIDRVDYLGLMRIAGVIIGNSSSAIIEASSFLLPAINIGTRQRGRERGDNVIDVNYSSNEIKSAISKALHDDEFRKRIRNSKNPYGDGKSGKRIADILERISINEDLLQKRVTPKSSDE